MNRKIVPDFKPDKDKERIKSKNEVIIVAIETKRNNFCVNDSICL